jgi:hypothetical protein
MLMKLRPVMLRFFTIMKSLKTKNCLNFEAFITLFSFALQAPRAEVVLVLSRSRSVTPATDYCYDRSDYPSYNYINSGRPPKILESPLDSKSLLSGKTLYVGVT